MSLERSTQRPSEPRLSSAALPLRAVAELAAQRGEIGAGRWLESLDQRLSDEPCPRVHELCRHHLDAALAALK